MTFAAFWPALDAGFVSWDDEANLVQNPDFRGLGPSQLRWMWTTTHLGHWMPLSWMTYGVDYLLWGLEPLGYHLTNLLLHSAAAALLTLLIARLATLACGDRDGPAGPDIALAAAIAALSFSIHPLRVESVAWVTERRDVLSGLLALASTWFYVGSATSAGHVPFGSTDRVARRRYLASLGLFACALMAKATVLTLPALLLLVEVVPLRRLPGPGGWWGSDARWLYARLAPFGLLSLASALISVRALGEVAQLPVLGKVAVSAYSLAFYGWKTLVPTGLAPLYIMPLRLDPFELRFVASFAATLGATIAAVIAWRRWPGVTVTWVAFVAALFPMLGIRQNGLQIAADRYTYHAAPVLAVALGAVLLWALPRWRTAVTATSLGVLAVLGAATWRQTGYWHDSESLWRRALDTGNGGWVALNDHGNALVLRGQLAEAEREFRAAIALNPDYAPAHMDLGVALSQQGRDAEAEVSLRRALALRPALDDAMVNLGLVLSRRGAHDEAIALYQAALRIDPRDVAAEINWGNALVRLGRLDDAIARYERAVALDPDHPQARANLEGARRARGPRAP